jgi:hypothetical protein
MAPGWSSWRERGGASRGGLLRHAPRRLAAAGAEPCAPAAASATAGCCGRCSIHGCTTPCVTPAAREAARCPELAAAFINPGKRKVAC